MLTLRENQKEPVRKAIRYFFEDNPVPALMVMPTAFGKSILAAEVAAACPDPILVVQPTKELLEQNLEKYRLLCGDLAPAGVYSASFGKKQIDHVTFATIGSIKTVGAQFRQLGFRKMLIDEAHLYPRNERSMLGQFLADSGIRQVLGITATPLKLEQFSEKHGDQFDKWSELVMLTNPSRDGSFFKQVLHVSQIQEMTSLRYWSPLLYEVLPFDRRMLAMNAAGSEFTEESAVTAYAANNVRTNILAALDFHRDRRHVLVFVPTVEEAEELARNIPGSAALSGSTPAKQRRETVAAFKEGRLRVLVNVLVLAVGFDYTKIDMIVTAFSTASVAKYYQVLGRGIRIDPEKKDCVVVDAGGNYERFGRIEDIRFEYDGKWRMYGSRGMLLSGLPVDAIGTISENDALMSSNPRIGTETLTFGKHKGKALHDVPVPYLSWLLRNHSCTHNPITRARICNVFESHVRDTRNEPPIMTLPDGTHAGEDMRMVPAGYLRWYYGSKNWNETNDSLRRGVEMVLNLQNN